MKPISRRPMFALSLFTTSKQQIFKNSHFLAFSTQTHQHGYNPRRHEEESRAVRVSVWWDFENCNIPVNTNAFRVAQCIIHAVRANGIKGPMQITAFGDVMQISRTNQEALSSTGISLIHVPSGGKNSADRSLLVDLMYWVSQNPPPAHLFLISGDRDFAGILHRLRMNNYNILLASPDSAPSVLCSAATIMWQWSSLLRGENLTGKLFNQPPDGLYHSWYGHYKAPFEDPFAVMEQSPSLGAGKSCDVAPDSKPRPTPKAVMEQSSCVGADESCDMAPDSKFRPIPKAVMKYISYILRSNPDGINISQLRSELNKSNLTIDRDLYGYKKFSRFLLAMPHVLELHPGNDGLIFVRRANTKFHDEVVPAAYVEPETNIGEPEVGRVPSRYSEKSSSEDVIEKSTLDLVPDAKVKAESTNLQEAGKEEKQNESSLSTKMEDMRMEAHAANVQTLKMEEKRKVSLPKRHTQEIHVQDRKIKLQNQPEKVEVAPPVVEIKDFSKENDKQVLVPNDRSSAFGFGIFRRMWTKLFGIRDTKDDEALSGEDIVLKKALTSLQSSESVHPPLFSPSSHEALINGKIALSGDAVSDLSSHDSSLFRQIMNWFKFSSSPEVNDQVEKNGETARFGANTKQLDDKVEKDDETADHFGVKPKQLEIFAKESFWKEMESFIDSSQGSASISKSRTREFLAQNLQKQGPPVLRSLSESDLVHLVDLLISNRKWVEECESRIFPFRVTHPAGKDPHNNRPLSSNGLSHIFSCRQPNLKESGEREHQNPHTGVPQPLVHRGSSSKPRSELLADCQNLVDQIVKEHPEGFNIGGFRKLFLEEYGYALDLQKLGYDKLVNLLQIMPGVIIESNLILPAGAFKNLDKQDNDIHIQERKVGTLIDSRSDSSGLLTKDDDSDSTWDELGPVDNSGSEKEEIDTGLTRKTRKRRTDQRLPDYEPLKEDDFSDSEEESDSTMSENERKPKVKEEESSLLQILDSWYGENAGDSKKDESVSTTTATDSREMGSLPSTPTSSGTKNGSAVVKPTRRKKPGKSYSFVTEPPVNDQDKMIDGILGSLKKSGEKSDEFKVLS